jgi:hypothetical protein
LSPRVFLLRRRYYIRASQEVSDSLVQLIERNDPEDLHLVEEALDACKKYKHALVKTAWAQLAEHRAHLASLRKADSLQREYRKEAQKRAAAESRFAQARDERVQLEAQLKALQRGVELSFGGGGSGLDRSRANRVGRGGTLKYEEGGGINTCRAASLSNPRRGPRRPRTEVCLICHKELAAEKYDAVRWSHPVQYCCSRA